MIQKQPVGHSSKQEANSGNSKATSPHKARYIRSVRKIPQLTDQEISQLAAVEEQFVFRANDYYLSLIDWDDPQDPIRNLIIPQTSELRPWGKLDASNELAVTVLKGVQHKYTDTVLLLCNEVCGAYCRYCFRKRLFMDENDEVTNDVSAGIEYIRNHPEINNVLLTGGDPLLMSARRIREVLQQLSEIEHIRIIRFGSKIPAFDPFRIFNNDELLAVFREFSGGHQQIYLMAHFDHPRELTSEARRGLAAAMEQGVCCVNQCPLIRGVNADADVLAELFEQLSFLGCPQYYLFQGRPTQGNAPFEVPITEGWTLFQQALKQGSGLARRARYCMSHETGKLEIVGIDEKQIYLRYHQAKDHNDLGRFIVAKRDDQAYWFDQLEIVSESRVA